MPSDLVGVKPPLFEDIVEAALRHLYDSTVSGTFNRLYGSSVRQCGKTAAMERALDGARPGEVRIEPGVYLSGKGIE